MAEEICGGPFEEVVLKGVVRVVDGEREAQADCGVEAV